jgi:hypothetical protein
MKEENATIVIRGHEFRMRYEEKGNSTTAACRYNKEREPS